MTDTNKHDDEGEFLSKASGKQTGLVSEFVGFLKANKKWWLAPILVVTLLLIGLVFLSASPAAPFFFGPQAI